MLDNYNMRVTDPEYFTEQKMSETWDFLNSIMATNVMKRTHQFLVSLNMTSPDQEKFKSVLFDMWFAFDRPRE
ncbi:unnamed protein product [Echinostoma caproni]|uniref:Uridylate-specific endoribonuclease n=1 Tax=Echinostoma caproni TaxID=27848 RepID=A0A3P8LAQ2_9TREM|nr:unnamed protein product [Echinostoma caproni]